MRVVRMCTRNPLPSVGRGRAVDEDPVELVKRINLHVEELNILWANEDSSAFDESLMTLIILNGAVNEKEDTRHMARQRFFFREKLCIAVEDNNQVYSSSSSALSSAILRSFLACTRALRSSQVNLGLRLKFLSGAKGVLADGVGSSRIFSCTLSYNSSNPSASIEFSMYPLKCSWYLALSWITERGYSTIRWVSLGMHQGVAA
jgi:hypothetical protein